MYGKVFRWQLLEKLWRSQSGAIYSAQDGFYSAKVFVYEWTVTEDEFESRKAALDSVNESLSKGIEVATRRPNLYFSARSEEEVSAALPKLQAQGLFAGFPVLASAEVGQTQAAENERQSTTSQEIKYVRLYHLAVAVLVVAIAVSILIAWSRRPKVTPEPPKLRVGLYTSPLNLPAYASKMGLGGDALEAVSIEWVTTPTAGVLDAEKKKSFDVVAVPLSAVFRHLSEFSRNNWKLIWLPEYSDTSVHVLRSRVKSSGHQIAYVGDDFGEFRLACYLSDLSVSWPLSDRRIEDTPEKVFQYANENAQNLSYVAVQQPFAAELAKEEGGSYDEVDENRFDHQRMFSGLMAVLVQDKIRGDQKQGLSDLLRAWKANRGRIRDDFTTRNDFYALSSGWIKASLVPLESWRRSSNELNAKQFPLDRNVDFIYDFGDDFSCTQLSQRFFDLVGQRVGNSSSLCSTITDDRALTQIDENEKPVLFEDEGPVKLSEGRLQQLCLMEKATEKDPEIPVDHFANNAFENGDHETPDDVRKGMAKIRKDIFYCVIGHADPIGESKENRRLAADRAAHVKKILGKDNPKLIVVSAGSSGAKSIGEDPELRKVEIKKLHLQHIEVDQ